MVRYRKVLNEYDRNIMDETLERNLGRAIFSTLA